METQVCTKCNVEKDITDFYVIKKTGYRYKYCNKCHNKKTQPKFQVWRKANKKRWNKLMCDAVKAHRERQAGAVYLLYTDKGRYVGQSKHVDTRIQQHNYPGYGSVALKDATVQKVEILEYIEEANMRLEREKYWINKLTPELNIRT